MKPAKKMAKLNFNKESLRRIAGPELNRAFGGFSGPPSFICHSGCLPATCATCHTDCACA
jgi:hypothetical protein